MLTPDMSYYLALKGAAVGRIARLNGAVVLSKESTEAETFLDVVSLEDWIVLGPNRLEIELSKSGDAANLELLLAARSGAGLQTIKRCAAYEQVPSEVEFHIGPPLEGAPPFVPDLEGAEEDEIRKFVVALHAAIAKGRTEDAIDMLRPRLERLARRLQITLSDAEQRQREELCRFGADGLELLPVSADAISLIPVCRGQLVRAEVEGRAPIYARGTDEAKGLSAGLALTFERSDHGWVVAR